MQYHVLAYYLFTPIEDPRLEVARHKEFFQGRDVRSRIYLSEEGINGQLSAAPQDAKDYMEWLKSDLRFASLHFKIHTYPEQVFPKVTVKYRKQLVALDRKVKMEDAGELLSPREWKEMLAERGDETVLVDVRNDYEWKIGHFEGSELPTLEQFRHFPSYAKALRERRDPKNTRVMMYCTGGIRCELYSALLKEEGFDKVYQLQGGVINYGLEEGNEYWRGKLFVFDDRLAVPISEDEAEVIGKCLHCEASSDVYYNCANVTCNELFLSCPNCAGRFEGCCSEVCQKRGKVRPYVQGERPKPFRKLYQLKARE